MRKRTYNKQWQSDLQEDDDGEEADHLFASDEVSAEVLTRGQAVPLEVRQEVLELFVHHHLLVVPVMETHNARAQIPNGATDLTEETRFCSVGCFVSLAV